MTKNIWERFHELINSLGLLTGGVAIWITGVQSGDVRVEFLGVASTVLFATYVIGLIFLAIRDARLNPDSFFVSIPFKRKK